MIHPQELFNKVWNHFIIERHPLSYVFNDGMEDNVMCRYRGENGAKCALGIFIPDECYSPEMEGKNAYALIPNYVALEPLRPFKDLLTSLQHAHDKAARCVIRNQYTKLKKELTNVAAHYSLKIP